MEPLSEYQKDRILTCSEKRGVLDAADVYWMHGPPVDMGSFCTTNGIRVSPSVLHVAGFLEMVETHPQLLDDKYMGELIDCQQQRAEAEARRRQREAKLLDQEQRLAIAARARGLDVPWPTAKTIDVDALKGAAEQRKRSLACILDGDELHATRSREDADELRGERRFNFARTKVRVTQRSELEARASFAV
tara:strand:- start:4 stop:576 length:573 start_codon:yes stop_codon:yes gene_type:complete